MKKIYLGEMIMQDLHKSFNKKESEVESEEEEEEEEEKKKIKTIHMLTSRQNNEIKLTANETCNMDMDVDFPTTSLTLTMTYIKNTEMEENSLTTNPNISLTINVTNTEEDEMEIERRRTPENLNVFMITNMTSTPITITLPTSSAVYTNDETLPDLTSIENDRIQEEDEVNCIDISDDEMTFMDENIIVPDVQFLHEEPPQMFQSSPLHSASREECSPLMNIVDCCIIEYTNVGTDLIGKAKRCLKC